MRAYRIAYRELNRRSDHVNADIVRHQDGFFWFINLNGTPRFDGSPGKMPPHLILNENVVFQIKEDSDDMA